MELESLLNELERIAAKLESSANYGGRAQGQTRTMRDA